MAGFTFGNAGTATGTNTVYTINLTAALSGSGVTHVIGFGFRADGVAPTDLTVNGVSAGAADVTVVQSGDRSSLYRIAAAALPDPDATALAVQITFAGSANRSIAATVHSTPNTLDASPVLATATDVDAGAGVAGPINLDLDVNTEASGAIVVFATAGAAGGGANTTYTETGVTQDADASLVNIRYWAGHENDVAAETPRNVLLVISATVAEIFQPTAVAASYNFVADNNVPEKQMSYRQRRVA